MGPEYLNHNNAGFSNSLDICWRPERKRKCNGKCDWNWFSCFPGEWKLTLNRLMTIWKEERGCMLLLSVWNQLRGYNFSLYNHFLVFFLVTTFFLNNCNLKSLRNPVENFYFSCCRRSTVQCHAVKSQGRTSLQVPPLLFFSVCRTNLVLPIVKHSYLIFA